MTKLETQIFYIIIIALSTFFAFKSQYYEINKDGKKIVKFRVGYLVISFLIPWIVISFTNIGSDYNNYYTIIDKLTWLNFDKSFYEEAGMNFIFLIIRTITNNIDVTIFFIKTLSVLLIYISIYLIRDSIKIGYAVLSYLLLIYLPSFYLLTIALAEAVVYLAVCLRIYKEKKILPVLLIILAAQLHNSAYLFLMIYFACEFLINKGNTKLRKILITIGCIIIGFSVSYIYNYVKNNFVGFHYTNYLRESTSGTGMMFLLYYIPLIYIYYLINIYNNNKIINNNIYIYILFSCLFYVAGYTFNVIDRMEYYILPLYSIFFADVMQKIWLNKKSKSIMKITKLELLVLGYILFRGYLVFSFRTSTVNGIGLYRFFNPFS